jgi:cysteine synthase
MVTVTGPDGIRTALELASKEGIFTGMLQGCPSVVILRLAMLCLPL